MPELPEVETVARGLQQSMHGKKIIEVIQRRKDLRFPLPAGLVEGLTGRTVSQVSRRAKYLLIYMDAPHALLAHLGMSGKFVVKPNKPNQFETHDHIVLILNDGTSVVYNDARRFGMMDFCDAQKPGTHKLLTDIGVEPLDNDFSAAYLAGRLNGLSAPIKNSLMDQKIVAGVGNIYASEALFRAGIKPSRKAGSLNKKEAVLLVESVKEVLKAAIKSGGSTLRDYVRSSGDMGYFQHEFKVYGRAGEDCHHCNKPIKQITQAGRSTFFCSHCQR